MSPTLVIAAGIRVDCLIEQPGGISVGKKGSPTCRRSPGWFRPKKLKLSADAASFDRGGHLRLPLRRKAPASWP